MVVSRVRVVRRRDIFADRRVVDRIGVLVTGGADVHAGIRVMLTQPSAITAEPWNVRVGVGVVLGPTMTAHATDRDEPIAAERRVEHHGELVRHVAGVTVAIEHGLAMYIVEIAPVLTVGRRNVVVVAKVPVAGATVGRVLVHRELAVGTRIAREEAARCQRERERKGDGLHSRQGSQGVHCPAEPTATPEKLLEQLALHHERTVWETSFRKYSYHRPGDRIPGKLALRMGVVYFLPVMHKARRFHCAALLLLATASYTAVACKASVDINTKTGDDEPSSSEPWTDASPTPDQNFQSAAGPPVASHAGFRMLPNGDSVVTVEVSQKVPVHASKDQRVLTYRLQGASAPNRVSRMPLIAHHFNSRVAQVRLRNQGDDLDLIIELRQPVNDAQHEILMTDGGMLLEIVIPRLNGPVAGQSKQNVHDGRHKH